jgi:6-phosphogluconolactonase/glucosamine-6-phosphate isomerase/deaminase
MPPTCGAASRPVRAGSPSADVALTGLTDDGALGALAPGSPSLAGGPRICRPVALARAPHERITVTLEVLRAARTVVAAAGPEVASAVAAARRGAGAGCPAGMLPARRTRLVVDAAAARFLRGARGE